MPKKRVAKRELFVTPKSKKQQHSESDGSDFFGDVPTGCKVSLDVGRVLKGQMGQAAAASSGGAFVMFQ